MLVDGKQYLKLIGRFLNREITVSAFEDGYLDFWYQDREEEDKLQDSWEERYDLKLWQAHKEGKISGDEFSNRWFKLWKYENEDEIQFIGLIESIFVSLDSYCGDPELRDEDDIDEEQLRKEVKEKYEQLVKIPLYE